MIGFMSRHRHVQRQSRVTLTQRVSHHLNATYRSTTIPSARSLGSSTPHDIKELDLFAAMVIAKKRERKGGGGKNGYPASSVRRVITASLLIEANPQGDEGLK